MSILGSHGLMQEEQFPLSPKSESAHSAVRAAFDNVAIDQVKGNFNFLYIWNSNSLAKQCGFAGLLTWVME